MSLEPTLPLPTTTPDVSGPAPATSNRSALLIVFLVVFIDLLGFGIVLPLLPRIADKYVDNLLGVSGEHKASSGLILGLLMSSFSLMQFLFAPGWGRLSDRIGRRPILLLGLGGSVVFYALFGYATSLPEAAAGVALALFFVARSGAGIAGATIATAQAVIADSTPPDKRKHGMALIGAAFGIGFTFGPLIGFAAMTWFPNNHEAVGYTAAALSFVSLCLAIRLLPETRRLDGATPARRKIIDFSAVRSALGSAAIGPVILTFFLASMGFGAFETTLALLLRDVMQFDLNGSMLVFAYIGFILMLTQGYFYRRLAKKWTETSLMTLGLILMALGVGGLGWVTVAGTNMLAEALQPSISAIAAPGIQDVTGNLLWPLGVALTFAVAGFAFLTPSAQALVSRRTDADRQGEILGVNQSASAMARILGPILGVTLYKATDSHLLPYVFGAAILLVMLPMMPRIRRGG